MVAPRSDRFLRGLIADTADKYVLTTFGMFLQDQVRVICHLAHLHNETENVGVVVQHDTSTNICIELPSGVRHDAGGKVTLDLAEEFIMDGNTERAEKINI